VVYAGGETFMVSIGEKDRTILLWSMERETRAVKEEVQNEMEMDQHELVQKKEALDAKLRQLEMPQMVAKKTGVEKFGKAIRPNEM
jgi:hypothetical protein